MTATCHACLNKAWAIRSEPSPIVGVIVAIFTQPGRLIHDPSERGRAMLTAAVGSKASKHKKATALIKESETE
jgi:hypothetical protein